MVTQAPDAANKPPMVTSETPPASPTSEISLSYKGEKVNKDYGEKEVNSRSEDASFFDVKTLSKINPDEVVSGMWEDGRNSGKSGYAENVEKSQLESVENL